MSQIIYNTADNFSIKNIHRVTAVWGFSEAAFGGILHALRIPFTGLFIGGAAVIFITLISHYSNNKSQILKSTVTVILIKAFISPYTPLTAYIAVGLQGILGYIFFSLIRIEKIAAFLLGIFSLFYSAFQKLIILTLLFGTSLWNSIDEFVFYVFSQFGLYKNNIPTNISFILVFIYVGLHVIGGVIFGITAARLPKWLLNQQQNNIDIKLALNNGNDLFNKPKRKKKKWWQKPSGLILVTILILFMIITYISPQQQGNKSLSILIMLVRAFSITFLWFSILSPFVLRIFNKIVEKKKFEKASEINSMTSLFPDFKIIINYCWKMTCGLKGWKRFKKFLSCSLSLLLTPDFKSNG